MSKDMMPKRWSVDYDGYMEEGDEGDYVEAKDVEPLVAEIERLRARVEVLERVREAALQYLQAKTVEGARYALDVLKEAKP